MVTVALKKKMRYYNLEQLLENDTCNYGRLNKTYFSNTRREVLWL